jgi:hypothetical protein
MWSRNLINGEGPFPDLFSGLSLNGQEGAELSPAFTASRTIIQSSGEGTVIQRSVSIGVGTSNANERKLKKIRRFASEYAQ